MGGLSINVGHLHDRLNKVTLTYDGLLHRARQGYFFEIADAEVQDKSKANILAKGLVLLQISWTVLQCLSRKATGLPLSILEVHILVHAGCALIMYILWFNKPLDVDESTALSPSIPDDVLALMLVRNRTFGTWPIGNMVLPGGFLPARACLHKSRAWPSEQAAESTYLVWNRYPKPHYTVPDGSSATMIIHTHSSRLPFGGPSANVPIHDGEAGAEQDQHDLPEDGIGSTRFDESLDHPAYPSLSAAGGVSGSTITHSASPASSERRDNQGGPSPSTCDLQQTPANLRMTQSNETSEPAYHQKIYPPSGVKIQATLSTGQCLSDGVGPNAYPMGKWREDFTIKGRTPIEKPRCVEQVSPSLRKKLPLPVDHRTVEYYCPLTISLSKKDILRWQLAGAALAKEAAAKEWATLEEEEEDKDSEVFTALDRGLNSTGEAYFVTKSRLIGLSASFGDLVFDARWRSPSNYQQHIVFLQGIYQRLLLSEELQLGPTMVIMMLPGLLYGGLHLSLWNYVFPTTAERTLWRISGVTLIAVPTLIPLFLKLRCVWRRYRNPQWWEKSRPFQKSKPPQKPAQPSSFENARAVEEDLEDATPMHWITILAVDFSSILIYLIASFYIFARVFIIVESFISLRHVPKGVYTDVGWSKYIPHL